MSNKNTHIMNELNGFYSAQNAKDLLDFFGKQTMVSDFPFALEKKYFFENLAHFIRQFPQVRLYVESENRLIFNSPTHKIALHDTVQSFRASKKEEQYHPLPVLLMELYHRTQDDDELKNQVFCIISSLNRYWYVNIHTYTKMEHDKIKPFAADFINTYMESLNLCSGNSSSKNKSPFLKLVKIILENRILEDEINQETAFFIARTRNDDSFDSILQKNYPLLYKSRSWISSSFAANHNLTSFGAAYSDKTNSWDHMLSKVGIKNIYRSHKLLYPEEGFLFNFAEKLDGLSGKTTIEAQHSIFKTLKSLLSQATPEMFESEHDKKSLVDTLSHTYNVSYLTDYLSLLEKKSIPVDYNQLFMTTLDNSKRHPEMHVAILKFNKEYSFDVKEINTVWSRIIRSDNIELLEYICQNLPDFPKVSQERIAIFYGKNLNSDILEFELLGENAYERKEKKLYFHKVFLDYVWNNYDSKQFATDTLPHLTPNCIPGEMKSLIESKLIVMLAQSDINSPASEEEVKHKRRI